MRFGIAIPQHVGAEGFDATAFKAHLERAEELGFESAWVQEQVLGPASTLSPLGALTYAAACTERLRLGCAVLVTPLHNPVHLAKEIATLDQLSHGRLELGIGAGGRARPFAAFGVNPPAPVARFTEGLELMKACWRDREITFHGRFWKLERASMAPKPAQRPHPPIWVGGSHPNGIRRAVHLADGFIGAGSQSTAQFAEQARIAREELARLGRDPASFRIAKRVYVHVDDDASRGARRLEAALTRHYGRGGWSELVLAGPPERCVAGLREVVAAGAELILLNPLEDETPQMERLAAEVVPALLR